MSMIDGQAAFLRDVRSLLEHAAMNGFVVTLGEAYRTPEQQAIYLKTGRSKTMASEHLNRRAVDLNFFRGGKLCGRDEIKPLGDFWENLDPLNRWGGNWRGLVDAGKSNFIDAPHFERRAG